MPIHTPPRTQPADRPILEPDDALRRELWSSIEDIAHHLAPPGPPKIGTQAVHARGPSPEPDVTGGLAGIALFFAYLAHVTSEERHAAAARWYLNETIEVMADWDMDASLFSGFCGIAWIDQHVEALLGGAQPCVEDPYDDLDEVLSKHLNDEPWRGHYDLLAGAVGMGVYALRRQDRPQGRPLIDRVLRVLEATAQRDSAGVAWATGAHLLPPDTREMFPHGYFNLGMAHGQPGVIAFLSMLIEREVCADRATALLEPAVSWLLDQRNTASDDHAFGHTVVPGSPPRMGRSAWCYGDAGVSVALLRASRSAGQASWEEAARHAADMAARSSTSGAQVNDATLCHGSAGLGHIFHRLFRATAAEHYRDAALRWFEHALELRRPGKGIAGYQSWGKENGVEHWIDDPGFLMGAAGIGLAFLGAVSTVEPGWDELMLLSCPDLEER